MILPTTTGRSAPTPTTGRWRDGRRHTASVLADQARDAGWTHGDYLTAVLEREVSAHNASGAELRIRAAGSAARKTLDDFDWDTNARPANRSARWHPAKPPVIGRVEVEREPSSRSSSIASTNDCSSPDARSVSNRKAPSSLVQRSPPVMVLIDRSVPIPRLGCLVTAFSIRSSATLRECGRGVSFVISPTFPRLRGTVTRRPTARRELVLPSLRRQQLPRTSPPRRTDTPDQRSNPGWPRCPDGRNARAEKAQWTQRAAVPRCVVRSVVRCVVFH